MNVSDAFDEANLRNLTHKDGAGTRNISPSETLGSKSWGVERELSWYFQLWPWNWKMRWFELLTCFAPSSGVRRDVGTSWWNGTATILLHPTASSILIQRMIVFLDLPAAQSMKCLLEQGVELTPTTLMNSVHSSHFYLRPRGRVRCQCKACRI